jgi:5'-deoxynucleotidase YfbR-like HD superfamily hydrolase
MNEHFPVEYVDQEAARRIEELQGPFELAHQYARVERATLMPDGKPETDGEHGISLAIIATCYATKYHPELDPYKVFFYGVMHDVDEAPEGDVPTIAITEEGIALKDAREERGVQHNRQVFAAFPVFLSMLDEMRDLTNPESQFGKALDKLTPGFTHADNLGRVLKEVYRLTSYEDLLEAVKLTDKKMYEYAAKFVDTIALRQEIHRKVARIAFSRPFWVDVPLF